MKKETINYDELKIKVLAHFDSIPFDYTRTSYRTIRPDLSLNKFRSFLYKLCNEQLLEDVKPKGEYRHFKKRII